MQKRLRTGYRVRRFYRRARFLLTLLGTIAGASAVVHSAGVAMAASEASFLAKALATIAICAVVPWVLTEAAWRWHRRRCHEAWQ